MNSRYSENNTFSQNSRDSQYSSSSARRKIFTLNEADSQVHQRQPSFQSIQSNMNPVSQVSNRVSTVPNYYPPKPPSIPTDIQPMQRQSAFSQPLNFERKTMFQTGEQTTQIRSKNKLEALSKLKYLNPLARLQYEDRELEVYTKISKQSQEHTMKKIKAKNQLANFDNDPIDQQQQLEDLIQFKLGKTGKQGFITHFDRQQSLIHEIPQQYCTNCQSFLPKTLLPSHSTTCKFQYSLDPQTRKQQISQKTNKLYKLLLQQQPTEQYQFLKNTLIQISTNDPNVLTSLYNNLLNSKGQIGMRVAELIGKKIQLFRL